MRSQGRIAFLLIAVLLAGLFPSGFPAVAVAAVDTVTPVGEAPGATETPAPPEPTPGAEPEPPVADIVQDPAPDAGTSPDSPQPEAAPSEIGVQVFDGAITIWSDSEALDFGVNPVRGSAGSRTRRVNLSVTASQPYALTVKTTGDFTILTWPAYGVGKTLPPSVMSFSRYGSSIWRQLSSLPTTAAEEPDVAGPVTRDYSFVFDVYSGGDPSWDVMAGGYEGSVCFNVVPLPGAPLAAAPATTAGVEGGGMIAVTPEDSAVSDPAAPDAPDATPGPQPSLSEEATPPPLPIVKLKGAVTATLTSTPRVELASSGDSLETTSALMLWLADSELASAVSTMTCAELGGYTLLLTLDGVQVGELMPVAGSDLFTCRWDTSGIEEGEHLLEVVAKASYEDPGFVCWSTGVDVRVTRLPVSLSTAPPAAVEESVTSQPLIEPDATAPAVAPDGGGGGG